MHARAPDCAATRARLAPRTVPRSPLSDATRSPGPKPSPSRLSRRRLRLHRRAARRRSSPRLRAADAYARRATRRGRLRHHAALPSTFRCAAPRFPQPSPARRCSATVRQPCSAAAAHYAAVRVACAHAARCAHRPSWAARAARAEAELGCARVAVGRASAVNAGCARMAMGRAPAWPWAAHVLCIWAERGFGPVALKLIFLFFEYIQILANLKICVGFI
jgi:hypothetical protein